MQDREDLIKFGVKLYTRNFDSINKKSRDKIALTVVESIVLKCLYSSAASSERDITVYRGTKNFKTILNDSFISTSLSKLRAEMFGGKDCCLFVINVKKGNYIIKILENSFFPTESEILLLPHSKFEISNDFKIEYTSPETVPKIVFSNDEIYILKFIYELQKLIDYNMDDELLSLLRTVKKPEYLIDVFLEENLVQRLHLTELFLGEAVNLAKDADLNKFSVLCTHIESREKLDIFAHFPFARYIDLNFFPQNIEGLNKLEKCILRDCDVGNISSNLNLSQLVFINCKKIKFSLMTVLMKLERLVLIDSVVDIDCELQNPKLSQLILIRGQYTKNNIMVQNPEIFIKLVDIDMVVENNSSILLSCQKGETKEKYILEDGDLEENFEDNLYYEIINDAT